MKTSSLKNVPEEGVSHDPRIRKRTLLRKGDVPAICNFARSTFAPGLCVAGHAHQDMVEVFLVDEGTGIIKVDGQEILLEPGLSVAVEPGETHEITNNGKDNLVLTYFGVEIKL